MKKVTLLLIAITSVLASTLFGLPAGLILAAGLLMSAKQAPQGVLGMNLYQIDQAAQDADFSNYDGDPAAMYTGFGDDFVDFGGSAADFGSELATDRLFTVTITNTSGAAQLVFLNASYAGLGVSPDGSDHLIKDGNIVEVSNAGVFVASGSPKAIANFLGWVKNNPTSIVAFKVVSSNEAQLAQTITLRRESPFKALETEMISLASYTHESSNNTKVTVTVRRPFQLDNQTEVSLAIPAGTSSVPTVTTITFYAGAVLNNAQALASKKKRAQRNPQVQAATAQLAPVAK